MKKLIAISVMLALVAGAVFAETSVGGNLKIGTNLLAGDADGGDVMAGRSNGIYDSHVNVSWSGDNAGGMMRLWSIGQDGSKIDWTPDIFTFWWWKPIEQLRLQLGKNADGDFGFAQITDWGFTAEAKNNAAINEYDILGGGSAHTARGTNAFGGGFGDLGLAVSILPAPGVAINIGIPFGNDTTAKNVYMKSWISANIGIPDVGTLRIGTQLKGFDAADEFVTPDVFVEFYVAAIEGMGIDIGVGFKKEFKLIGVGLGYTGTFGDVGLKVRVGADIDTDAEAQQIGVGILPTYNAGSFTFFFNAGFGMVLGDNAPDPQWYVNPYIQVPANAGSFYAGVQIVNPSGTIGWAVPIGWNVYF